MSEYVEALLAITFILAWQIGQFAVTIYIGVKLYGLWF